MDGWRRVFHPIRPISRADNCHTLCLKEIERGGDFPRILSPPLPPRLSRLSIREIGRLLVRQGFFLALDFQIEPGEDGMQMGRRPEVSE